MLHESFDFLGAPAYDPNPFILALALALAAHLFPFLFSPPVW